MPLFLLAVGLGLATGYVAGGRLAALGRRPLSGSLFVGLALASEVVLGELSRRGHLDTAWRAGVVVSAELAVGLFLLRNRRRGERRLSLLLIALGWAANLVVMARYGAMPVSASGLRRAGLAGLAVSRGQLGKHLLTSKTGGLYLLSDWIPLPALHTVASPGDLAMALGIAALVAGGMRKHPGSPARAARAHSGEQTALSPPPF